MARTLKSVVVAAALATLSIGAFMPSAFANDPAPAPAPAEKCDKDGKACKKGKDCKPEHCKKDEAPAPTPAPAPQK